MKIEKIPSDQLVKMTNIFHRIFCTSGCDPACHCCYKKIPVGDQFKLSTIREVETFRNGSANMGHGAFVKAKLDVLEGRLEKDENVNDETKEVMLCATCTPELFHKKQHSKAKKDVQERLQYERSGGGCFRINGKIIH